MASKMEVDSEEKKTETGDSSSAAASSSSAAAVAASSSSAGVSKAPAKKAKLTVEWPDFDLEAYAARYSGKVLVDRLVHIADVVDSVVIQTKAMDMAMEQVQRAEVIDVNLYGRVMEKAQAILGPEVVKIDSDWMQRTSVDNDTRVRQLEDEIQRWRNMSNRENICKAYLEAGTFYCNMGSYSTAISRFMEAKSFASDPLLLLSIHVRIITASIQSGALSHVRGEASQALSSEVAFTDDASRSKALVGAGLCMLRAGRFETGVSNIVGASFAAVSRHWPEALAGEDVALYGGLCALASLRRGELKKRVLDNTEFKRFLGLRPELHALVAAFYESEYGSVMTGLKLLQRELIIDPFTYSSVDSLLTAIRGKALVQYFSPYSVMDMHRMADAFKVTVAEMERELSNCIADGHINAKIDSYSKIVYAAKHDRRKKLFKHLMRAGDDFERDVTAVLLRMSLNKNQISVSQARELMDRMADSADASGGGVLGSMARVGGRVLGFAGGGGGGRRG